MEQKPELSVSDLGGIRNKKWLDWTMLPYEPLRWVVAIYAYGAHKYSRDNWKKWDTNTDQDPMNHLLAHAHSANELQPGSEERMWQTAKVAWNALASLWFDILWRRAAGAERLDPEEVVAKRIAKLKEHG